MRDDEECELARDNANPGGTVASTRRSTEKMIAGMRMWASLVVLAIGLISMSVKQMDYLNGSGTEVS